MAVAYSVCSSKQLSGRGGGSALTDSATIGADRVPIRAKPATASAARSAVRSHFLLRGWLVISYSQWAVTGLAWAAVSPTEVVSRFS